MRVLYPENSIRKRPVGESNWPVFEAKLGLCSAVTQFTASGRIDACISTTGESRSSPPGPQSRQGFLSYQVDNAFS